MRRRRAAGSGSLVGIGTTIIEIRLPQVPRSSRLRTDIGIIATSGSSGSASRSISQSRTAPAQSVTTTSLTVTPNSRRTWRTASSERSRTRSAGARETGPLNGVFGGRALVTSRMSVPSSEPSVRRTRE